MAQVKMVCPFSSKLCEDCPVYRGRHYFLCFCEKYRGHLDEAGKKGKEIISPASHLDAIMDYEIPDLDPEIAIDPFEIDLN